MHVSRRTFLAAGVALAAAPKLALANDEYYGGWPIGIQSYSLRNFSLEEAMRHVEGLGLRYIEFYSKHLSPQASDQQIADVKALVSKAGVTINAHGVNRFTADHAANRRLFEFAKQAGFRNLTADPSPDSFDSLDKLCEEFKIRIAIHNHGPGHRYDTLENVQQAVKGRHKLIGACVDTGHVLRSDQDPVKWVAELGPRVFALHLKDVAERQKRTHDVVLGAAHLDVDGIFKTLKKISFPKDGSISLEYESNPQNPIDDIKQCLAVVKKAVDGSGPSPTSP